MKTLIIGKNCIEVEKTDSTNSYMARLMGEKALFEGAVVITRSQEHGRGQRGASWESEPGKNLTLSILLHPAFLKPDDQFQLNKAVSLGVMEFVQHTPSLISPQGGEDRAHGEQALALSPLGRTGSGVTIKWPNDIYIGSKKVAGILIESTVSGNKLQQSVVGIGINVNQEIFSNALPNPTSLKLETGREFDLKDCLEELCSCIEARYLELRAGHADWIDVEYLKALYRFGVTASYQYKGETMQAKITGVSKVGKLILETEKGKVLECDLKEVVFL